MVHSQLHSSNPHTCDIVDCIFLLLELFHEGTVHLQSNHGLPFLVKHGLRQMLGGCRQEDECWACKLCSSCNDKKQ